MGRDHEDLPLLGELHGIANEVDEDLLEALEVSDKFARELGIDVEVQFETFLRRAVSENIDRLGEKGVDLDRELLQLHLGGLELGEIEDVIDEVEERLAARADHVHQLFLLGLQAELNEETGRTDDAVHRGANFVTHVGEEVPLRRCGDLGSLLGLLKLRDEVVLPFVLVLNLRSRGVEILLKGGEVIKPPATEADREVPGAQGLESRLELSATAAHAAAEQEESNHAGNQPDAGTEERDHHPVGGDEVARHDQRLPHNEDARDHSCAVVKRRCGDDPVTLSRKPLDGGQRFEIRENKGRSGHGSINQVLDDLFFRLALKPVLNRFKDHEEGRLLHRRLTSIGARSGNLDAHAQPPNHGRDIHRLKPHLEHEGGLRRKFGTPGKNLRIQHLLLKLHLTGNGRGTEKGGLHRAQREELLPHETHGRGAGSEQHSHKTHEAETIGDVQAESHGQSMWLEEESPLERRARRTAVTMPSAV